MRPRELSATLSLFPAKTPTLPPATHTNSYALGGRDVLLVEPATPYESEQRAFIEWARSLVSHGRKLVGIVPTHHHRDHVGGLATFSRELGVPVWAHEETAARLEPEARTCVTRFLAEGDTILLDGLRPETWRVLFTPGHAPGHVCLFEEHTRTAIVGDMVASVGTILIAPDEGDMERYLVELERLAQLNAFVALPAHGEPIDEPTQLFRKYIDHRLMREAKVLESVRKVGPNGADAASLVPVAYDDTPPHLWPLAKLSLEAHLAKLVREGRVIAAHRATDAAEFFRVV
ncbi:Metallo-beta-lactamase family protein [Labilithrix luteola]|uniref:Metallo-beta-lactamase family protein n=1 Tax=Labilithrix luteola TaxID=1391654 RepID=A0A0K1PU88_9BACT|nr:MBL fold metallo-hydrolase [Labilithrix luteola]AKU96931.1 Metallo-beta-lactamase family protein [Labilithrix luteola]